MKYSSSLDFFEESEINQAQETQFPAQKSKLTMKIFIKN